MERIAHAVNKDATDIRLMHLLNEHKVMEDIVSTFKTNCNFAQRQSEIDKFNKDNAWRKKALKLSIMAFPVGKTSLCTKKNSQITVIYVFLYNTRK